MSPAAASATSAARTDAAARPRGADADHTRRADDFARLLREKDAEDHGTAPVPAPPAGDPRFVAAPAPAPAPAPTPPTSHPAAAAPLPGLTAPPAAAPAPAGMPCTQAVEACAALQARMDLTAPVDPAAARRFDVSIQEPAGLQLSLRVVAPAAADAGRWALSVASANLNPTLLQRNTGRLEERLRSKSLSSEPVRIEHDDES